MNKRLICQIHRWRPLTHFSGKLPRKIKTFDRKLKTQFTFSRFLTLPEQETSVIDMRLAAVVIISHLDRLAKPHLPSSNFVVKTNSAQQNPTPQIFSLGSLFAANENCGFTADAMCDLPLFTNSSAGLQPHLDALLESSGKSLTIKSIACGERHILLLTSNGELYSIDTSDSLANFDALAGVNELPALRRIEGFGGSPVLSVAAHCEGRHFLALNAEHHVYTWGNGDNGRLGHNDIQSRDAPAKVNALADKFITKIYCGAAYSAVVSISGELFTWGKGSFGSLGHGASDDKLLPTQVQALVGHSVVDVALGSGDSHSLCVTDEGIVFAWGDGDFGKLGNASCSGSQIPIQVDGLPVISRVFCGAQFSVALTFDGHVYTWGKRQGGRLGHSTSDYGRNSKIVAAMKSIEGPAEYCHIPKKICALDNKQIVDMAVGAAHCLAISSAGELFGWGRNDFQQVCHASINRDPIIAAPILIAPASYRINGIACGAAYSILFCNSASMIVEPRLPYVVDLSESTFKSLDQLLSTVNINETARHPPTQESECIVVACLNLLRLQFHALLANNISPKAIGLAENSRLLTSLKTRILQLAGGSNVLKTIQESAQRALQFGWSILLPSASERAKTLTQLLPSEPGVSTAGHRFMTDLLVGSLMAEEGLQTALKQAINSESQECSDSNSLPLMHLIKQLLRNNASLTQARLTTLFHNGMMFVKIPETLSPSLDLLHRFQRLLLAHIQQMCNDDLNGAETLLAKYIQSVVTLSVDTLTKAHEIAVHGKENGVAKILSADISDSLLYELLLGLVLLTRDKKSIILQAIDWNDTFVPLLDILDDLNRTINEADVQDVDDMGWPGIICRGSAKFSQSQEDAQLIRPSDFENHIIDDGKWIILNGFVYDLSDFQ